MMSSSFPTSTAIQWNDPNLSLSKVPPTLIHRVLLTEPSKLHKLSISSAGDAATPTFSEFCESLKSKKYPIKAAYRDHYLEKIQNNGNMNILRPFVEELSLNLKKLVPNRQDLHNAFDDMMQRQEYNSSSNNESEDEDNESYEILPLLIHIATSLTRLESPARAESTQDWIDQAPERLEALQQTTMDHADFFISSILYLFEKVELCEKDKQDFYFSKWIVPRIREDGPKELQRRLQLKDEDQTFPSTRAWLKEALNESNGHGDSSLSSSDTFAFLQRAWIRGILFRQQGTSAIPLPEVLAMDQNHIQIIRHATQRAVVGCALALFAAGSPSVLTEPLGDDPSSPVRLRRADLVAAMSQGTRNNGEEKICAAVLELAKVWNPINEIDETSLRNRTLGVLCGQDPVLKLMDGRMQAVFEESIHLEQEETFVMRSGRGLPPRDDTVNAISKSAKMEREFCRKGLSFYAPELAELCTFSDRIIQVCHQVHGELIKQLMKEIKEE